MGTKRDGVDKGIVSDLGNVGRARWEWRSFQREVTTGRRQLPSGRSAEDALKKLPPQEKANLTWWLAQQRRQGDLSPLITSYTLEEIKALPPPPITERRDRALEHIGKGGLAEGLSIATNDPKSGQNRAMLAAITGSLDDA
jgi:hypothetical protein